jgi:Coenzyme PQQ synthesis protein D (PqqD)
MRPVESGAVLVDMVSGKCFELNFTGLEVWKLLADDSTPASIADALATRYGVPSEVTSVDVERVIEALSNQRLVTLSLSDRRSD